MAEHGLDALPDDLMLDLLNATSPSDLPFLVNVIGQTCWRLNMLLAHRARLLSLALPPLRLSGQHAWGTVDLLRAERFEATCRMTLLHLDGRGLTDMPVVRLAKCAADGAFDSVVGLWLGSNAFGAVAVRALSRATWPNLCSLSLADNENINGEALVALADACAERGALPRLRELHIGRTAVVGPGVLSRNCCVPQRLRSREMAPSRANQWRENELSRQELLEWRLTWLMWRTEDR